MIISYDLAPLLVSMIPAATMAMMLFQITAFFLMETKLNHLGCLYRQQDWKLQVSLTHLPSMPETKLTLMAPRSPPTANMETMRDQIIVMVCGGGGSLCLSYQLLLMKLCMNCGGSEKLFLKDHRKKKKKKDFPLTQPHSTSKGERELK